MENFKELHEQESIIINGGTDDRGNDGCIPDPLGDLIRNSTGTTSANPDDN